MKKLLSYLYILPVGLLLLLPSCSKKIDEAYLNPNAPLRVPVETILPGIIANMAISFAAAGTNYGPQNDGQYIGRYVQYWATNLNGNQYDQLGGATGTSDVLGAIWAMHYYGQGQNLEDMVTWATEEEKWDFVGVGQAIRAWGWLMLTDMHGEVILKEAFDRYKRVFKYDEQQDVYEEVKRLCRLALVNLERNDGNVSTSKLAVGDQYLNGGDREKWKKFVYGVLAKTFHRTTNKANYQADSVVYFCDRAMQTNLENSSIKWSNAGGTGTYSYYAPFRGNVGGFRQTRFVANLLSGGNSLFTGVPDPRAPYLIRENPNGTYKGIIPNKGDASTSSFDLVEADRPANFWGGSYASTSAPSTDANARYVFTNSPIWPLMTASEIQFMKAEALYRMNDKPNALIAYKAGINLNFDQLISDYESHVPLALKMDATKRDNYINNVAVTPATADGLTLSHIMLQKYIAMYGWGFLETWVDLRRFHYTDKENSLQVYRDFAPPSGADLFTANNGKLVYRARPRYNSEYLYNVDELNRIGANALDYNTKEEWFSLP